MTELPEDVKKKLLEYSLVVAAGTGDKYSNGRKTKEKVAVAYVEKKKAKEELEESDIIPEEIDGWTTDVQEIGAIGVEPAEPQDAQNSSNLGTTSRHRPMPQGVSIGHKDITAGTSGMVMWKESTENGVKHAKPVAITNNHVAANMNDAEEGDEILQPGPYDGGKEEDAIGYLDGFIDIKDNDNLVDLAWYEPEGRKVNSFIQDIGVPEQKAQVSEGDQVKKFGRTTGFRKGKVLSTDARVRVNYDGGLKEFKDQIITETISTGGDSGSAVVNTEGDVVGLLFAGSSEVTIANKIENVIEASELYLRPEQIYS